MIIITIVTIVIIVNISNHQESSSLTPPSLSLTPEVVLGNYGKSVKLVFRGDKQFCFFLFQICLWCLGLIINMVNFTIINIISRRCWCDSFLQSSFISNFAYSLPTEPPEPLSQLSQLFVIKNPISLSQYRPAALMTACDSFFVIIIKLPVLAKLLSSSHRTQVEETWFVSIRSVQSS